MVFFVDSGGNVLNTTPENVYQGSANANEIVLVGQFPANSVVEVAYKTPNGIWTEPQVMTASQTAQNGFTVWKTRLNGVVTERFGKVSLQFYVHGGTEDFDGALLATAETSFNVGKGIPRTLPDNFPTELGYDVFIEAFRGETETVTHNLQTILNAKVEEVNSALDSKISKFERVGVGYYLYTYYQGETKPLEATNAPLSGSPSVILRDVYGRAQVYEPAADFDITNKIYVDRLVSERFSSHGGTIQGNVTIEGDLQVKGSTVTLETETLKVSDNYVVVNTDAVKGITSGIVIRTAHNIYWNAYGIVYNPLTDSVDIGEGEYLDDGSFYFDSSQMQSIATRAQNIPDGAILRWDAEKNTLVDSGLTYDQIALKKNVPTVKLEAVGDGSYALIVNTLTEE